MVEFGTLMNASDLFSMVRRSNPGIFPPDAKLRGWTMNLKKGVLTVHIETKEDLGGTTIPIGLRGEELRIIGKPDGEDAKDFKSATAAMAGSRIEAIEVDPRSFVELLKRRVVNYPHDAEYRTTQVWRPQGGDDYCALFRVVARTSNNQVIDILRDPKDPAKMRDFMPRSMVEYDDSDIRMVGLKN